MVVSTFSVSDKDGKEEYFKKNCLLVNVKPDIVLEIPYMTMSNADVDFQARNLQWRSYTTRDILSTTRRVELIGKKEFVVTSFDLEHEAFVVQVVTPSVDSSVEIYPSKRAQIAHLNTDEAP